MYDTSSRERERVSPLSVRVWGLPLLLFLCTAGAAYGVKLYSEKSQLGLMHQTFAIQREAGLSALDALVSDQMNSAARTVLYYANTQALQRYACEPSESSLLQLQSASLELAGMPSLPLSQLRFIDGEGYERIRVNNDQLDTYLVDRLQNKSSRYYFERARELELGALYISKPDLNQEHGQVVVPLEPTIRLATPVPNCGNGAGGVGVVNIRFTDWLPSIKNLEEKWGLNLALQSPAGEWVLGSGGVVPLSEAQSAVTDGGGDAHLLRHFDFKHALMPGAPTMDLRAEDSLQLVALTPAETILAKQEAILQRINRRFVGFVGVFSAFSFGFFFMRASEVRRGDRRRDQIQLHERTINMLPDALMVVDQDGHIRGCNSAAESMFGYPKPTLLTMKIENLINPDLANEHHIYRDTYFQGDPGHVMAQGREVEARRADGGSVKVRVTLSAVFGDREKLTVAMVSEVPPPTSKAPSERNYTYK